MVPVKHSQCSLIFNSNFCSSNDFSPHLCKVSYKMMLCWATQCWLDLLKDKKKKKSCWLTSLFCSYKRLQLYSCFWLASVLLELYTNNFIMNSASTRAGDVECGLTSQENQQMWGGRRFQYSPGFSSSLLRFPSFSSVCKFHRACNECLQRTFVFRVLDSREKPD